MAGSAFVSVKKALRDALQAHQSLDGIQVEYGWPGDDKLDRERIWLGRVRFDHDPASMKAGRVFRNEEGTVDVFVDAEVIGGSPEEADERAQALGQVIEEVVADNPNLGNDTANGMTVNAVTVRTDGDVLNVYNDRGSLTRITYKVRWVARLT